ncbi:MAG: hypothetical protein JSV91_00055 [Phycisphaerales bacterium]|nr:MAG: hypothetical protein JSV91_00055 [Phycisphaerales bacterium]
MDQHAAKICAICGEDCANDPRIKDPKGRYYHRDCYERAAQAQARRKAASEAPPVAESALLEPLSVEPAPLEPPPVAPPPAEPPSPQVEDDFGGFAVEADSRSELPPEAIYQTAHTTEFACPGCGAEMGPGAVLCTNCGFSTKTGQRLSVETKKPKRQRAAGEGSLIGNLLSPGGVGLATLIILSVFFALATSNEVVALVYLLTAGFFGFGVWIVVLVFAFSEGIGQGFLTLCVPCYILYYVFGVCDNQYVKILYVLSILANISTYFLELPTGMQTF